MRCITKGIEYEYDGAIEQGRFRAVESPGFLRPIIKCANNIFRYFDTLIYKKVTVTELIWARRKTFVMVLAQAHLLSQDNRKSNGLTSLKEMKINALNVFYSRFFLEIILSFI